MQIENPYGVEPTAGDLAILAESGLTPKVIADAGIRRVNDEEGKEMVGRAGSAEDHAGLLFPNRFPGEERIRLQTLRRDNPPYEVKPDGSRKPKQKYLRPPELGRVYIPPGVAPELLQDVNTPIVITDGEKKGLALDLVFTANDGSRTHLTVALAGVWNYRGTIGKTVGPNGGRSDEKGLIPDMHRISWKERVVYVLYDADVRSNRSVAAARRQLTWRLQKLGAKVFWVDMPTGDDEVKGVDDLLAKRGAESVRDLFASAKPAGAPRLTPQERTHEVEELLAKVREDRKASILFDHLELLSELPPDEYERTKARLRETLGSLLKTTSLDRAVKDVRERHSVEMPDQESGLPKIVADRRQLRDISGDAINALVKANNPPVIFRRSGDTVDVRIDETGRAHIRRVDDNRFRSYLTQCADFVRQTEKGFLAVYPPDVVVKDVAARENGHFPPLLGISGTPIVLKDGTVRRIRGYDSKTKLYFAPTQELNIEVATDLTQVAARRAVQTIAEPLNDFPFQDTASKVNALAMMVTPVARALFDSPVPMGVIDKRRMGTGGTLLSKAIAMVASGRPPALITPQRRDEEWGKKITSVLYSGAAVVSIDNLEHTLKTESLASVLTNLV